MYTHISIGMYVFEMEYIYFWSFLVEWKFMINISSVKVKTKTKEKKYPNVSDKIGLNSLKNCTLKYIEIQTKNRYLLYDKNITWDK